MTQSIVYFIVAPDVGMVKIGTTTQLKFRMLQLRTTSPVPLELEVALPGDRVTEQDLHARFAASRSHGEWFKLTHEILQFIEGVKDGKAPNIPERGCVELRTAEAKYKATPEQVFRLAEAMWGDDWQTRFAQVVGVSRQAVRRWRIAAEEGRCIVPVGAFRALVRAKDEYLDMLKGYIRQLAEPEPDEPRVIGR